MLLICEEGEEEYDFSTYPHQNVYLEVVDQRTVTTKDLQHIPLTEEGKKAYDARIENYKKTGKIDLPNWKIKTQILNL